MENQRKIFSSLICFGSRTLIFLRLVEDRWNLLQAVVNEHLCLEGLCSIPRQAKSRLKLVSTSHAIFFLPLAYNRHRYPPSVQENKVRVAHCLPFVHVIQLFTSIPNAATL